MLERKTPVCSVRPTVARLLTLALDELMGQPVPRWQRQIEVVSRLPRSRQPFVSHRLRNLPGQAEAR